MAIDPAQLLKRLEPPVRQPDRTGRAPKQPFESQDFEELLQLVSTGDLRSGRAVDVGADINEPLTEEQLDRLAAAADRAEAAGARRSVMLMEGRGFIMHVPERMVESELSATETAPITGIDSAVYVARPDEVDANLTVRPGAGLDASIPSGLAAAFAHGERGTTASRPPMDVKQSAR